VEHSEVVYEETEDMSLMHEVSVGLADELKKDQSSGSVLSHLDGWIAITKAKDGASLHPKFESYLDGIFNKYKEILGQAEKDISINMEFLDALDAFEGAKGEASLSNSTQNGRIKLVLGNPRNRSNTEVLAEELQHVLIKAALQKNDGLRADVLRLRSALAQEFNTRYGGEGYKVFLETIKNPTEGDHIIAKAQWEYAFDNKSFPAEEFLAHATTNQALVNAMQTVDNNSWMSPVKTSNSVWGNLWNKVVLAISAFFKSEQAKKQNTQEYAVEMLHTLLKVEHRARLETEKSLGEKVVNKVGDIDLSIETFTSAIKAEAASLSKLGSLPKGNRADRVVRSAWATKGLSKARNFAREHSLFNNSLRDFGDEGVTKFYRLFNESKAFFDSATSGYKDRVAKVLLQDYGFEQMDMSLRRALKRVLIDMDGQVLGYSKEILSYLKDDKLLESAFKELTKGYSTELLGAIDSTSDLLVHNTSKGPETFTNAFTMWKDFGSVGELDSLDKAITLKAFEKMHKGDKALAIQALEANPTGADFAAELYRSQQEYRVQHLHNGELYMLPKGGKMESFPKDFKRYLVPAEEMKDLTRAGMHSIGIQEDLSKALGKPIYIVIGPSLDSGVTTGLIKLASLGTDGDSVRYLLKKLGGHTTESAELAIKAIKESPSRGKSSLVPTRNKYDAIVDYSLRIPYEDKVKYLQMEDDIVDTMALTVTNVNEVERARHDNFAALSYLQEQYGKYKHSSRKWISVSSGTKYWDQIPMYIQEALNGEPLMVPEELILDLFGYEDVSLMNAPWIKNSSSRKLVAKKLETAVKEVVSYIKLQTVVFTVDTVMGNNISNMVLTMMHTKNYDPIKYIKDYKKSWALLDQYSKDFNTLTDLKVRHSGGVPGLERRIAALEKTLSNSPVHILAETGHFSSALEDIGTFNKEGMLEEQLNKAIGSTALKDGKNPLKTMVDIVYTRKDNPMYDTILKATSYSDIISKMMLLSGLKTKAEALKGRKDLHGDLLGASQKELDLFHEKGTIPATWISQLDAIFVNYNILDNKYVKYGNDVGGILFTKYAFRIIPALIKLFHKRAATVGAVQALQHTTGADFGTPFDMWFSPLDVLANRAKLWSDPEQLLLAEAEGPGLRLFFE